MPSKIVSEKMNVKGLEIGIYTNDFENEYISLTDIARYRNSDDPRFIIQNWMKNRHTVEFLAAWEAIHNPNFKRVQMHTFLEQVSSNRFVMTPEKWISGVDAIGVEVRRGRGGGTFAHSDIAMSFAAWISPEFQLYLMKDYRRLKEDESSRLSLNWNLNRAIAKLNYRIHTDAIRENLIPPELTKEQIAQTYASEADLLNVAIFGKTASEWRTEDRGRKGNIRDYASIQQLLILANLESYNSILIQQGEKDQGKRLIKMREMVVSQLRALKGAEKGLLK